MTNKQAQETYRDCIERMGRSQSADRHAELRRRWPTLGDCFRAMSEAYVELTTAQRAKDATAAQVDLDSGLTCLRCGWHWWPQRPARPARCPACNTPYWDRPRVRATGRKARRRVRAE